MPTIGWLYRDSYRINDDIEVLIPKLGEIIEIDENGDSKEDLYYGLVSTLTAVPIDMMLELDDAGIDYTTITDYDLFILMFDGIKGRDTSLVFKDLDLSQFSIAVNTEDKTFVVRNPETGVTIDKDTYRQIAGALRKIHHLKKNRRKPANKEAQEYMLERARIKQKRNKNRTRNSDLEPLIVALVNAPEFSYDYETVKDLTIYQFNESVKQIVHRVSYDNMMHGVYAGTVDKKHLSQDDLNWLKHK